MDTKAKQLLSGKLVPAVLSIILGIVVIIARRGAVDLLVKIIGGLVIAAGIGFIALYLTKRDKGSLDLTTVIFSAVAAVLIGILIISFAPNLVDLFPILMGAYLILNGLSNLTMGWVDPDNRIIAVILSVLVIILGVMIVMRPGFMVDLTMVFIGAAFIVNGVFDLLMMKKVTGSLG